MKMKTWKLIINDSNIHPRERILAVCDGLVILVKPCVKNNEWVFFNCEDDKIIEPTHWMPLPEPPNFKNDTGDGL